LKETSYKVKKAREDILNQTGEEPKLEELSKLLDIDMEEIVASLEANVEVESIHKTIYQNDGNAVYLMDKIANVEDENEKLLDHLVVENLMNKLESQEQKIIEMRYFENRTQTEIAKEMNISQVQVSRLEKKILLKMRGAMSGGW
jgi:RNA polymerase sporulation-specific sigma factor